MAKKFGGTYSPDGNGMDANSRPEGANYQSKGPNPKLRQFNPVIHKAFRRLRTYRFFDAAIGVGGLFKILTGHPIQGLAAIIGMFALLLAGEITKAGIEAEAAYNSRAIARAPAFPRKIIGAAITGVALSLISYVSMDAGLPGSLAIGLVGLIGMLLAFGTDPLKAKGISGENQYEATRAADAIERAQNYLDEIRNLSKGLPDRKSRLEVESLAMSAEEMFRALEKDPADYRNSRRYLGVYLQGARDATQQFLDLPKNQQTAEAEDKYLALIRELDEGFQQKRDTIMQDNRNALNVEIDVLRDRLASEGITIAKEEEKS